MAGPAMTRPIVHVGMAKAASTFLQRDVFGHLPGVKRIGKHGVGADVKHALQAITRRVDVLYHDKREELAAPLKAAAANAVQQGLRPILSEENLSVYRYLDPATMAARLRDIFGEYDVIFILRDAQNWLRSQYLFRLQRHDEAAVRGFPGWLEHHLGAPRVGSDMGELWFAHLCELYQRHCGGTVHVLSYHALSEAPERFATDLGAVLDVPAVAIEARLQTTRDAKRHKHAIGQSQRMLLEALVWVDRGQPGRLVDTVEQLSEAHAVAHSQDVLTSLRSFRAAPSLRDRRDWANLLDAILEGWPDDPASATLEFPADIGQQIVRQEAAQLRRLKASQTIDLRL